MRSHALRKGFMSTCERTGMKSINVKMLMGHSIGVENSYYKPTDDDLLNGYMTHAADALKGAGLCNFNMFLPILSLRILSGYVYVCKTRKQFQSSGSNSIIH